MSIDKARAFVERLNALEQEMGASLIDGGPEYGGAVEVDGVEYSLTREKGLWMLMADWDTAHPITPSVGPPGPLADLAVLYDKALLARLLPHMDGYHPLLHPTGKRIQFRRFEPLEPERSE